MVYRKIDLHLHSNASDGALSPAELVAFAVRDCGVDCLALTDHDTLLGLPEAREAAASLGVDFHPGIEFSADFAGLCIHIVGLGIRPDDPVLESECRQQSERRMIRSKEMGKRLAALGFPGCAELAYELAPNKKNVSRSHFALALIQIEAVSNEQEAFDRFIGPGLPGYVAVDWPDIRRTVALLHQAGGVAILAHPGRYQIQNDWERFELVKAFKAAGGDAIEVTSGSQPEGYTALGLRWMKEFNLLASTGSDFHRVEGCRPMPGSQPALPSGLRTVLDIL